MIRKVALLALVACLLLTVLSPGLVQTQGGLTILGSSAQAEFPSLLNFTLSAQSDVNIIDIRLCYTIDYVSFAEVISEAYVEFVPATAVDISWPLQMVRIGGLPPGSSLEYWWKVEDANGNRQETAPATVQFDDTRYEWQSITEGEVTIYWYEGDASFAQELMATAQQALDNLAEDAGAELERPAKLYIYANTSDLRGAMIYPQEWTGGVAYTRYGIMAIGISSGNIDWGKRAIAHELTHLVIHQMTLNPYNDLPNWLDEGLAMRTEGELSSGYTAYIEQAIDEDSLISVQSLCSPFSAYGDKAALSYAQGYSLVDFLITSYGRDNMLELLNTFSEGSGYDAALERVYGFDMDGLDALWRDYVTEQYQPPLAVVEGKGMHPALIVMLSAWATWFLLALGLAAERWAWRRSR